jgi:hypothetical protein
MLDTDVKKLARDLGGAAHEEGVGLAILVDEAQDLDSGELATLCTVAHAAAQDRWPVLFAFAGLPSLPRMLAEAKSYAERFTYLPIGPITHDVVGEALTIPAGQEDASWDDDAVALVVDASGRYPYFLQQFGRTTWTAAGGPNITLPDARLGVSQGTAQLDNGFFRVRWDRATKAEQKYLRAMAEDGDLGSSSGTVATRLHRKPASLGPTRAGLIAKGLVYAPEHGVVAFTVPGMAAFIGRQVEA